ncbi:hypothetical protein HK098_000323 [Nowakowskiella sp. JEL0407]|nr:hypothetical protein HK098_000323 [Nowakowskiella sp. JEL0407]
MPGGKPKVARFNLSLPKYRTAHPNGEIKTWKLFKGDFVEVIDGRSSIGGRGVIKEIDRKRNLLWVEGVKLQSTRFSKKVGGQEASVRVKEMPIHYSNVQLVDPVTDKPTSVKLALQYNPEKGFVEKVRITQASGSRVPLPDLYAAQKAREDVPVKVGDIEWNVNVTPEVAKLCTWKPDLTVPPFPNAFMNELERMKRRNKESQAL